MIARKLFPYVAVVLIFVLLVVFEADYLYTAQEQNLFLHTPLFFQQQMVKAGGLLTWASSYLTQFFYYPMLGAGILCLLWAFLMWLQKRVFRLQDLWLTLVPIACLLLTVVTLGYWIYYLKLRGPLFDATLGTTIAVSLVWIYRLVPSRYFLRTAFLFVAGCIGYPLFGFYGLWAVLLMALTAWGNHDDHRITDTFVALLTVIAIPLVCYHVLYHETNIINIYWTALPVFAMRGESYPAYQLPYLALVASISLMAALGTRPQGESKSRWTRWMPVGLAVVSAACVAVFWMKDDNFHRELSMYRSLVQQDWKQVLQTAKGAKDEPTRAMCMMKNVALFRLGRQGDEMFQYPEGAKRPAAPFPVRMVQTVGKQLYLEYGIPNYCYRWCMEDGVEYGWTVERMRLMVLCSLLNGEMAAAQHLVSQLKKTDFHRQWAQRYQEYIRNPRLLVQDKELSTTARLQRKDNFLTGDMAQLEQFLLEHFITAESRDPLLQEQILLSTLQAKNMPLFWRQFYQYTEQHREGHVPRHYQEAACLFGHLQNVDVSHMPFDRAVVIDYQNFAGTVGEYQRQGKSIDQIRPLVHDRFCTTYYYDFYFNRYQYVEN